MSVTVNGKVLSTPDGIAESDGSTTTTYIPMYYVDQALTKVGYTVTWDGTKKAWNLATTASGLNFTSIQVGTGNTSVLVNGQLVKKFDTVVQTDPSAGAATTYIPIYYVTPLLAALGVTSNWNGTTHVWSMTSSPSSAPSSNPTLPTPTGKVVQSGSSSDVDVQNATSGATVSLYTSIGKLVISTVAASDGTATFYNVAPGTYYIVQKQGAASSHSSSLLTVSGSLTSTSSPTIYANQSNGIWYIAVNNTDPNATVTLYSTSGVKIASGQTNSFGFGTFNNVSAGMYYVVAVSGGQSYQSNAITVGSSSSSTPTPTAPTVTAPVLTSSQTGSTATLTVNKASAGATVTLYKVTNSTSNGTAMSVATANTNGVATFTSVSAGTYKVTQTVNGTESVESNAVTVSAPTVTTPTAFVTQSSNVYTVTVTGASPSATITLYKSNGAVYSVTTASNQGVGVFVNVAPGSYDATQTVGGVKSQASNVVNIGTSNTTLAAVKLTGNNSNGVLGVTVTGAQAGAQINLYRTNGSLYATTVANASGAAVLNNLAAGSYYAIQLLNGQQSAPSNAVTI